ncbi:helix-turn-helix domain-containing protein [Leifsonia sp. 2MCAF36]|uniref:helix-turn-helix domain-containing protein n=1 Tax=Leifsonia sp. 2MCAF36 TaxID=3232988 RepID=UPI003F94F19B
MTGARNHQGAPVGTFAAPGRQEAIAYFFGEELRNVRKRRQLRQVELAELIGIDVGTYGRIERGEHSPRLTTVVALADALGIHITELVASIPGPTVPKPTPIEHARASRVRNGGHRPGKQSGYGE